MISAHQNDLKTQKIYQFEAKKKNIFLFFKNYFWYQRIKMIWKNTKNISIWSKEKNTKFLNFFKSTFETQKQTGFYKTQLKKHVKTAFTKTAFQTHFFSEPRSTKHSLVCYQTPCCVCFTANTKAEEKQTQPKASMIYSWIDSLNTIRTF